MFFVRFVITIILNPSSLLVKKWLRRTLTSSTRHTRINLNELIEETDMDVSMEKELRQPKSRVSFKLIKTGTQEN